MSVPPDLLERMFPAPPDAFDRLVRRRAKRERTRKLTDGALALILVIALVAALAGTLAHRQQRPEPLQRPITPSNAADLSLIWSSPPGVGIEAAPVVVGDHVYVLDYGGELRVYPTMCGAKVCAPLWSEKIGDGSSWTWGAPVASGDRLYVPTSTGRLLAFSTACGSGPCRPIWSARLGNDMSSASPVVADGIVYVASDSSAGGAIGAFSETCARSPRPCPPLWIGKLSGGFLGSRPAVVNGVVYVGSKTGTLYAFPTSCIRTGGTCQPRWTATTSSPPFAAWSRMIAPILVSRSTLFVPSGSALYAYPTTCAPRGGTCRPTWVSHLHGWINSLALAGDSVYVSSSLGNAPPTEGRLSVLPQGCARRCNPAWTIDVPGGGNPTIVDGVLYVGWVRGASAFDATCGADAAGCAPLWQSPTDVGSMIDFPTVAGGAVYAGAEDGRLYAFGVRGNAQLPGSAHAPGSQRGQSDAVRRALRPARGGRHRLGGPAATAPRRGAVAPDLSATTACRRPRSRTCP